MSDTDSTETTPEQLEQDKSTGKKLSFLHIIASTIGAAFGVRNSQAHEEDFAKAKASTYIIAGVVFTALFVLAVVAVVKLVLSSAGV